MKQKIFTAFMIGGLIGALFGLAESLFWLFQISWWKSDLPTVGMAMLIYGIINAVLIVFWVLWTPPSMPPVAYQRRSAVFGVLTMIYLIGGFYLNLVFFPKITSVYSLLFTAIWTFGWFFFAILLLKWRTTPCPNSPAQSRWGKLGIPAAILVFLIGFSFLPVNAFSRFLVGPKIKQNAVTPERPNVLLIVMDTTRADRFSSYGYNRLTTPNLDRLAGDGVLFEKAVSAAPWTLPSHASLFSGLLPSQHHTGWAYEFLDDSITTLPELLRNQGYQTVGFSNNPWVSRVTNLTQGFEYFEETWLLGRLINRLTFARIVYKLIEVTTESRDDRAKITNLDVKRWFNDFYNPKRPFFLFINYLEPHYIYEPPEPYRDRFLQSANRPSIKKMHPQSLRNLVPPMDLNKDLRAVLSDLYDGEVAYLDMRIGELLEELKRRHLYDNTVIIITSDHGEDIGDHHNFEHQFDVYDTLLHVPLIVRYPPVFPKGKRVETPVSLIDIVPTLVKLLKIEASSVGNSLSGKSLVDSLDITGDIPAEAARVIVSEYDAPIPRLKKFKERGQDIDEKYFTRSLKSAREGAFKFIWASDGRNELYNLRKDPYETHNLNEEFPSYAKSLDERLKRVLHEFPPVHLSKAKRTSAADEATLERIHSLGYV